MKLQPASKKEIKRQHKRKAAKQRIGRSPLVSVSVRFGDHLVAYDVKHSAARKGERKRKNSGG